MATAFPLEPSLWAATAAPALPAPPLDGDVSVDVCIVGGGFAGLSTALHLAEQGTRGALLEEHEPGELQTMFPGALGERLAQFAGGTADSVFDLIKKHNMDVPLVCNGWIQGAHTAAGLDLVSRRAAQWAKRGASGAKALSASEVAALLGTNKYVGGWLDPRGGGIQPLSYARGLARAAAGAGASIHGLSPATALQRDGSRWKVTTAQGAVVRADRVVLCTNGYTGALWPGLARSVITPNSFQVATEPLPEDIARTILPQGHVSSDTRQLLLYFRLDHQRRLIMGGRGPFREPTSPLDWGHLERVIGHMFPAAANAPIAFRWCGRVAITRDFLPHLHEPAPGLLIDIGCMGRGVGLQTSMGRAMANYIVSGNVDALPVPVTGVKAFPLHRFRQIYLSAIIAWYRMRDGGLA